MSDPVNTKTWEFDLNNFIPANSATAGGAFLSTRQRLLGIKEILVNNGSTTFTTPWVVQESSDSVTAGGIGYGTGPNDKWLDSGDLVWADDDTGNARSWTVVRQAAISAKFEVLIICEEDSINNDGKQISLWVAQAGFRAADGGTDGTTTTPPTASDQRQIRHSTNFGYWGSGGPNTEYSGYTNVWMSSDGQCTRIMILINDTVTGAWAFDVPKNPTTGWADPYYAFAHGTSDVTTDQITYAQVFDAAGVAGRYSGTDTSMYFSGEGMDDNVGTPRGIGQSLDSPNQLNNTYIASEMGLVSETSSFVGRHGQVFDWWWGYDFVRTGRYYPEAGTKTFIQIADTVMPWDGSTKILTR